MGKEFLKEKTDRRIDKNKHKAYKGKTAVYQLLTVIRRHFPNLL
jgi:hypothetical protein